MGNARSSRQEPWPYLMKLGKAGLMLVPSADGILVGRKTQTLENVAPTEQQYDSAPVYKERTFAFRPTRGMGERVQSSHTSRRYRYMINCQVVGNLFGKGPRTHTISPSSTGSVRDFVEGLHGGVLTQFILAGRYALRRADDTSSGQAVSRDFGSGRIATSAVRFKGNYASPVDGVYVATDNGQLWQYDGASWNSATLPAGFTPSFLETIGDELWAGGGNVARKCTGDPLLAGSWSGAFTIGEASSNLTAIRQVDNRLFFFKDDGGVYNINADGSDNDLFPGLRVTRDSSNARTVQAGLDSLWFRMGQSFYRLTAAGGAELTPVGPERLRDNDSEVQGPVQCFSFWGTMVGFAATYYGTNSYLMSYGQWQTPADGDAQPVFVDQWDGALVKWANRQATCMRISGIASPDTRLYVGFADGTWDYIKLVPNPFAPDSGAEFTLDASTMYVPIHHAMFQADWKSYSGFSVFGPVLNASDFARIRYRTELTKPYATLSTPFTSPAQRVDVSTDITRTSVPGTVAQFIGVTVGSLAGTTVGSLKTRQNTDLQQSTAGKFVDVKIELINSSAADTPVIEGIGIHESVRPRLKLDFSGIVDARGFVAKLDGSTDRRTGDDVRDLILQAAGAPGAVTMTLPDETVQGLSFFGYTERMQRSTGRGRGWLIEFQATQFRTETIYGTVRRLRGTLVGDLRGVTVGTLKTL